jgi:hypothetical protein
VADAEQRERRGVVNPRVVDLVSVEAGSGCVVLLMLEQRPWDSEAGQLRQLEDKFNAYLGYVLDGHLAQQYPEYAGRAVRFRLECVEPPRGEAERMLRAMRNFAAAERIDFEVRPLASAS